MTGPLDECPDWAVELLSGAAVARLGLLDERGAPRVLPVAFAVHEGALWSAVDRKPKRAGTEPARLRFLRRNPSVALTVDRYEDDWRRLAWVQVLGEASLHAAGDCPQALRALRRKYAQYGDDPPGPVIRIEPLRVLSWRAAGE